MDASEVTIAAAVDALSARAQVVRQRFSAFETDQIGREWTTAEIMSGFVVDVGDLTRLVMAATGARHIDDLESKLEHELSDCLWSVLVLAEKLDVDLGRAFEATMENSRSHSTHTDDRPIVSAPTAWFACQGTTKAAPNARTEHRPRGVS